MNPYRQDERLTELLGVVQAQGWELTPDQEAELTGFDVADVVNELKSCEFRVAWFKELEEFIYKHRKQHETEAELMRAKLPRTMDPSGQWIEEAKQKLDEKQAKELSKRAPRATDPDQKWNASLTRGRESVNLIVPIEEVPSIYVKERVEQSPNLELVKATLEAGREIVSTVTGLPCFKIERNPSVRIVLTDAGKMAEIQVKALAPFGFPQPSAPAPLQLVKEG